MPAQLRGTTLQRDCPPQGEEETDEPLPTAAGKIILAVVQGRLIPADLEHRVNEKGAGQQRNLKEQKHVDDILE